MNKKFLIFAALLLAFIASACKGSNTYIVSNSKNMRYFDFYAMHNPGLTADYHGIISGNTITVRIPLGADLTNLTPRFATTGVVTYVGGSIQNSGRSTHDFSRPVFYKVVAEDGTMKKYMVIVLDTIINQSLLGDLLLNGDDVTQIDTSGITDMSGLFDGMIDFNQDISGWDVSNVTNMDGMFVNAHSFNQDISGWDVSNVESMDAMFLGAHSFNQDLSSWDTSSVTSMSFMFIEAYDFQGDISSWDTSEVTDMFAMFAINNYDQDLSSWDTSKVTDMSYMFYWSDFNQDISSWDVSNVENFEAMFALTPFFNQDISLWDVSKGLNFSAMFLNAQSFNQDLSSWSEHLSPNIVPASYTAFSAGTCPLLPEYHPDPSWDS